MGKKPDALSQLKRIKTAVMDRAAGDDASHKLAFPLGKTRTFRFGPDFTFAAKLAGLQRRKIIRAENAVTLARAMPRTPFESTHALIPGDFVFCDILTAMVDLVGAPRAVHISSLSLSLDNVGLLRDVCTRFPGATVSLALSYYFEKTNKSIFRAVKERLVPLPNFKLALGRIHTKIILFHVENDRRGAGESCHLVLETSANLRSSGSLEQVSIFACPQIYGFHAEWMEELHAVCESDNAEKFISFTGPAARERIFTPGA
jgi:hypothetical protein